MELQRIRAKTTAPAASPDRKELAQKKKKKCLNQDQRAVWILGFGPSVLPERGDGVQEEGWKGARNCLKKERPCTHWPHGKLSFRKSAWSLIL